MRPWASLSAEEQQVAARKMEVFAAMVDRMDRNVARLQSKLKQQYGSSNPFQPRGHMRGHSEEIV